MAYMDYIDLNANMDLKMSAVQEGLLNLITHPNWDKVQGQKQPGEQL